MGVWHDLGVALGLKAPVTVERALDRSPFDYGAEVRRATHWAMALGPEQVWNTQPYVRTVVTFLARNIAQLGVHAFRRIDDDQRQRLEREHPLAQALRRPNPNTTTYELVFGLVCDKALYERAYWYLGTDNSTGAPTITRIPPSRVTEHIGADPLGNIDAFRVQSPSGGPWSDVPASRILYFPGWNPTTSAGMPSSPLESIKAIIAEQAAAFEFRKLAWANGAQVAQVIERPQGVPWKDGARDRFIEDVRSQFGDKGPRRNGVLLLEDGMRLSGEQFNAREAEWIEAAKLSLALVAAVYHVNPTMVGLLDNANYSNVREFRKMLYGDTLGPLIASIEDRINAFLVPRYEADAEVYVEFNIAEKLQGSFEEQAQAMQTAVGAPWMLRSEARARLNLPPVTDADELVVPLNVLIGGQASPTDAAPPGGETAAARRPASKGACVECGNDDPCDGFDYCTDCMEAGAMEADELARQQSASNVVQFKRANDQQRRKAEQVLAEFFGKQRGTVLSRLGAGDPDWWDAARWDAELADRLHPLVVSLATALGTEEAARLGFDGGYDEARTIAFLRAAAERYAANINTTTKGQLDAAVADPEGDPAHVYDVARDQRAPGAAVALTTFATGFALREAAAQIAQVNNVEPTKTWITGPNARPSHARMNGETVPVNEPFSNGMQWPAESGDVDEVAGCNCSIAITV